MSRTFAETGIILAHLYRQAGLEASLGYLLREWEDRSIARVNCFCYDPQVESFRNVACVYQPGEMEEGEAEPLLDDFPVAPSDRVLEPPLIENNFTFAAHVENHVWNIYAGYRAFARIPFSRRHDLRYFLTIFSTEPGVFTPEFMDGIREVITPLAMAVAQSGARSEGAGGAAGVSSGPGTARELLGLCDGLRRVAELVDEAAPSSATVLIIGETGVGKEMVADALHEGSAYSDGPLVKINCGAIPESLIDSLFFGHEKGAFTGAQTRAPGYFEQAQGGTLFLDEVGELSPAAQVRLLRVLDRRVVQRVGSATGVALNVRVIAATNRDLRGMIATGGFRRDLWYRLAQFPISVPPLRERKQDINSLTEHFLDARGMESVRPCRSEMVKLMEHDWPGNVRELEFVVDRAAIALQRSGRGKLRFVMDADIVESSALPSGRNVPAPVAPAVAARSGREDFFLQAGEQRRSLEDVENDYIRAVLRDADGRVDGPGGAAEILKVHPQTLYRKLRKFREKG